MKNILIPTDFSPLADKAYEFAMSVFKDLEVNIHLLSIVPVTPDVLFDKNGELLDDGIFDFNHLHKQKQDLEMTMEKWLADKPAVKNAKVKIGRISNDILQYLDENTIDLLVMGTGGASGMKEYLMGSHTAYIAMRSPVPVLSVKEEIGVSELNNILLAGDFRDPQIVELSIVKDIKNRQGARLQLVKINTPGDFETNETVVSRMREFAEMNELNNVEFHVYCDYSVEKGIVSFSEENNCDLIAIGSQQRTGLSRVVRRSISYEAINHIKKPIISFPVR